MSYIFVENQVQNSQCIENKGYGALIRENQNANNKSVEKA